MIKDDWSSIGVVPPRLDYFFRFLIWLLFGSFLNGRPLFVDPCLVPPWCRDVLSWRYGLLASMTSRKGYNLCHVFVLIWLCSFQVQCSIFSWADLKDMMRQAGEVTYTDAHQRMVSTIRDQWTGQWQKTLGQKQRRSLFCWQRCALCCQKEIRWRRM